MNSLKHRQYNTLFARKDAARYSDCLEADPTPAPVAFPAVCGDTVTGILVCNSHATVRRASHPRRRSSTCLLA